MQYYFNTDIFQRYFLLLITNNAKAIVILNTVLYLYFIKKAFTKHNGGFFSFILFQNEILHILYKIFTHYSVFYGAPFVN